MAKGKQVRKRPINIYLYFLFGLCCAVLASIGINIKINEEQQIVIDTHQAVIKESEEKVPAKLVDDRGEIIETTEYDGEEIPTYEEVDGGRFEDIFTGVSEVEGEYEDLGDYEKFDTSSPEAFRDDTINKCIIYGNKFGAQCVSLARAFWWNYANRDVSTCGTGMAKGMMNCADQNAGNDFEIHWKEDKLLIQPGDWLVFDGGQYGHVGMALGGYNNGYVTLLGENQGGHSCGQGVGGSATNIINISLKNLIGFYRPKAYIKPAPTPTPAGDITYSYVKGDFFSKVLVQLQLDEGKLWGKDGTVRFYTQQLVEQGVLDKNGNVKIGVPFTLVRK